MPRTVPALYIAIEYGILRELLRAAGLVPVAAVAAQLARAAACCRPRAGGRSGRASMIEALFAVSEGGSHGQFFRTLFIGPGGKVRVTGPLA